MNVIETFSMGKFGDPLRNEDSFVITGDFVAVIDGVSHKRCPVINGKSGGRFASEVAAATVGVLPGNIDGLSAVKVFSERLRESVQKDYTLSPGIDPPSFAIVIYSRHRQQIWRVGDPLLLIDGTYKSGEKAVDHLTCTARAYVIEVALRRGASREDFMKRDIGREFIQPMLDDQHVFANKTGPFGYGVIDGGDVPEAYIDIIDVGGGREVVLASDGYPDLKPTLAESERILSDILHEDPLMFRRHKSTKGVQAGHVSFDDRTYVRFAV